ncbi:MAG: gliding motility-associated C-terminal domain-containing protein [Bacteroidota bacterium]
MKILHPLLLSCIFIIGGNLLNAQTLTATITEQGDVLCHGDSSGYAIANASGGSAPYNYKIGNEAYSSNKIFPNLGAGTYIITVLDAMFDSTTVSVTIGQPDPFELMVVDNTPVTCFGDSTGNLEVAVTGGVPPYQYSLNNGFFTNNAEFKDLPSAAYQVLARDANLCVEDSVISVSSNAPIRAFLSDLQDVRCFGDSNGQVTLNASGGIGNYQYALNGGALQTNGNFTDLAAGAYQVNVADDSTCAGTFSFEIEEPDTLDFSLFSQQISCYQAADGEISLTGSGGTSPYSYSIDGGSFQFQNDYGGLTPGDYTVQVRDINGCTSRQEEVSLTEPLELTLTLTGTDVTCKGGNNGELRANIQGGTGNSLLVWNDIPGVNDLVLTDQTAGLYFAVAVDANGCQAGASMILNEPETTITIEEIALQGADCSGGNGLIEIVPIGGVEPYELDWGGDLMDSVTRQTDLVAGIYTLRVTDAIGCTVSESYNILATSPVVAAFGADRDLTQPLVLSDARVQFTNQSQGAVEYVWDFGDGRGVSQDRFPIYTYETAGEFTITLVAIDPGLTCPDTVSQTITVRPQEEVFFPTAFTPDGDDRNDRFVITASGLIDLTVTVFDRWGRPIRTLLGVNNHWDGRNGMGQLVYPGVYVYHVDALFESGYKFQRSGTVTVLR